MPLPTEYSPPIDIAIEGATAPCGTPFVRVSASGREAWVSRSAFTGAGGEALRLLRAANIPLLPNEWAQCKDKVAKLISYPARALIDRPGWNARYFALPDGTVFSPRDEEAQAPVVLFQPDPQKCAAAGTVVEWEAITSLLRDHPIATFVLFAAFVGPFLSATDQIMNQGFELAGSGGG